MPRMGQQPIRGRCMIRLRVRIRFRKQGDLRLISHRDLLRVWERLFRRADLRLSLTEGYSPKPRMHFPSALALGQAGLGEVLEIELAEEISAAELKQRLTAHAVAGLFVDEVELLPAGTGKARAAGADYTFPIPPERTLEVQAAIDDLSQREVDWIERPGGKRPVDLKANLERLVLRDGLLHIRLAMSQDGGARPQDLLERLGLGDLAAAGAYLTRERLEIRS